MAWPEHRVAVEYQGDQHRTDLVQWRRDQERWALLAAAGWADVHRRSATFAAEPASTDVVGRRVLTPVRSGALESAESAPLLHAVTSASATAAAATRALTVP